MISSITYASSNGDRTVTTTDENGNATIQATDSAGRMAREEYIGAAGGHTVTLYGYDDLGRRSFVRSPRGLETRTIFDPAGREVETAQTASGQTSIERRGYDRYGRVACSQSPLKAEMGGVI